MVMMTTTTTTTTTTTMMMMMIVLLLFLLLLLLMMTTAVMTMTMTLKEHERSAIEGPKWSPNLRRGSQGKWDFLEGLKAFRAQISAKKHKRAPKSTRQAQIKAKKRKICSANERKRAQIINVPQKGQAKGDRQRSDQKCHKITKR